jgi:transmembrane sensor
MAMSKHEIDPCDSDWRKGPEQFEPTTAQYERAMEWYIKLRDSDQRSTSAFEDWKRADLTHEFAYSEVVAMFAATTRPSRRAMHHYHRHWRPVRNNRFWRYAGFAIAASIALLVASPAIDTLRYMGADAATRPGEMKTVRLSDGSRITLNSASAIDVSMRPDHRAIRLLRGEAYFDVAKNPHRPFTVDAGKAAVQVLGTKFNIRMNPDQSIVSVTEGRVRTVSAGMPDKPIILVGGQEAMVSEDSIQLRPMDTYATDAWRRHVITFQLTPLRTVVQELNRYRSHNIYIANQSLVNLRVTGIFSTDKPSDALKALEANLGLASFTLPTGQTFLY